VPVSVLFAADVVFTGPLDDRMWLAPHGLELASGESLTGYELTASDNQLVLLLEAPRAIRVVSRSAVRSDVVCAFEPLVDGRSSWDLSNHVRRAVLPRCP
jgi:hypothetical protein